mmetsp:Transcript_9130/g.22381  ORF Transcript_9130/g.22381 Transcript_9130/m.22381 type:complete len:218 (+) Transcript_9130:129-782(+)
MEDQKQRPALFDVTSSSNTTNDVVHSSNNDETTRDGKKRRRRLETSSLIESDDDDDDRRRRRWADELAESAKIADKDQVAALAKDLFVELWKRSDAKSAKAAAASFFSTAKATKERNRKVSGQWYFETGSLAIYEGVDKMEFDYEPVGIEDCTMERRSSLAADPLVYKGETMGYDFDEPYEAEMTVRYDPVTDTLKCDLDVGDGAFTAVREMPGQKR